MMIVVKFWKSLLNFSKVAPKTEPIGANKQSPEAPMSCASSDCQFLMVTQLFDATFEKLNKAYFFQHCNFLPFNSFYWSQIKLWTPSDIYQNDRIEQANIQDLSDKFATPNFMMKKTILQKVKKIWKFDCIWHQGTTWLLTPTFGGPNFPPKTNSESLEQSAFGTPFVLTQHL